MSKYEPLGKHLAKANEERIKMTFEEIERLGVTLPDYMRKHQAGWYGTAEGSPTHKQKQAWQDHGYTVETVDLKEKEVTFIKVDAQRQRKAPRRATSGIDINKMAVVLLWAGGYVKKRIGHELFNLTKNPIDGRFYGNCPETNNMPIHRFGAKNADKSIDGILVVYAQKKEKSGDYEIIGFAPSATVYREGQSGEGMSRTFPDTNGEDETSGYCVASDTLYDLQDRVNKFTIIKSKDSNPFRNQRIYADQHPELLRKIADYVEGIMEGKEILDNDLDDQDEIQRAEPATPKEIADAPDRPLAIVSGSQGKGVGKDSRYSKAALMQANFKCQVDESHETFKTRIGNWYMEGHHLIPCTLGNAEYFKDKYGKNIDCTANIISLCPTCHRAVHFGEEQTKITILTKLYAKQKEKLANAGIPITLEELIGLYINKESGQ